MSVYKVKGIGGELEVFEDKLTIAPIGILGFIYKGLKGTKTIPFTSITAIQHKKAGLTAGYLQFTLPGGNESRGGLLSAVWDENTFVYDAENTLMGEIKTYLERKIQESRSAKAGSATQSSAADELLKLVKLKEQGVLSEEEFMRAKHKILDEL